MSYVTMYNPCIPCSSTKWTRDRPILGYTLYTDTVTGYLYRYGSTDIGIGYWYAENTLYL